MKGGGSECTCPHMPVSPSLSMWAHGWPFQNKAIATLEVILLAVTGHIREGLSFQVELFFSVPRGSLRNELLDIPSSLSPALRHRHRTKTLMMPVNKHLGCYYRPSFQGPGQPLRWQDVRSQNWYDHLKIARSEDCHLLLLTLAPLLSLWCPGETVTTHASSSVMCQCYNAAHPLHLAMSHSSNIFQCTSNLGHTYVFAFMYIYV